MPKQWRLRGDTFASSSGERAVEAGVITRKLNWSPHMFRRTVASILHTNGMPPVAIQHQIMLTIYNLVTKALLLGIQILNRVVVDRELEENR